MFNKIAYFVNTCIDHSYLPEGFMKTIVVPIVKNRTGDHSNLSNYRPISLATIISKITERLINKHLGEDNLPMHCAQFGFRKNLSTDLAIFALKTVVNRYLSRETPIYACFLDLSKAFDSIKYDILWAKLRDTKVPLKVTNLLEFWYDNQSNYVKWGNALSEHYKLECGVRQGGVTSVILFNYYVNSLIEELSSARVGCYMNGHCVNNLSYADDMVLLSPSVAGLRKLLAICERYVTGHGLKYNVNKTEVMVFRQGKGPEHIPCIKLCGSPLNIVSKFKYLGHIITDTLNDNDDIERQRRVIAMKSNMLARRFAQCSEQVRITLSYSLALWVGTTARSILIRWMLSNDTNIAQSMHFTIYQW